MACRGGENKAGKLIWVIADETRKTKMEPATMQVGQGFESLGRGSHTVYSGRRGEELAPSAVL